VKKNAAALAIALLIYPLLFAQEEFEEAPEAQNVQEEVVDEVDFDSFDDVDAALDCEFFGLCPEETVSKKPETDSAWIEAEEEVELLVEGQIRNLRSAVKAAKPGDYIILPSGKKYVITKEEIDIVNDRFDYGDLSRVEAKILQDETKELTISEGHKVYIKPNGDTMHRLITERAFVEFMRYVEKNYYLGTYRNSAGRESQSRQDRPPENSSRFLAKVELFPISDGTSFVQALEITVVNYQNRSYTARFFATDENWIWGEVKGTFGRTP
jgi:hypothetical protein